MYLLDLNINYKITSLSVQNAILQHEQYLNDGLIYIPITQPLRKKKIELPNAKKIL